MRILIASLFCCLCASSLPGVKTEALRQGTYDAFAKGELKGLTLTNLGEMHTGLHLEKLAELDADAIQVAVQADDGTLYLGTSSLGKIFKLAPEGEPEVILEPREIMTSAMAIGPDGALYAATSPGGRIYRIVEGKRPEVYFDPEEMYVWDLLFDADGALFVATGNAAKIYRLPADFMPGDEAEVWFSTDRTHINTLAFDQEGRLLAGAGPKAYLYRLSAKDKAEVLFNAGTDEIADIVAAPDGHVYFSTLHKGGTPPNFSNITPSDLPALVVKVQELKQNNDNGGPNNNKPGDSASKSPTAAPSFLYRISAEGFGEPVWSPGNANILSFLLTDEGRFWVGTDDEAQLFTVNSLTDWARVAQAETGGSISVLLTDKTPDSTSLLVCTSNPAAVYRATTGGEDVEHLYTSEALDAGAVARWGRLLPVGSQVDSSNLTWRTRTGNSPEPDDTWADWSDVADFAVGSPAGRYLQYEATFASEDVALRDLRVFYAYDNAPPVVNRINILPVGIQVLNIAAPPKPPVNLNQLTGSKEISADISDDPAMRTQVRFSGDAGAFSFGWNASDPNGDDLTYTFGVAPEGSEDFTVLVEGLNDTVYSTSMRGFTDGYYRAEVIASDADSNPPGEGLTGTLISSLFLIDNSSPVVTVESQSVEQGTATVVFAAKDAYSILTAANYTLDGKPAKAAFPEGGFFDAQEESFQLVLEGLKPGKHSLLLEVSDESGNKASAQVVLSVEE